MEGSSRGSRSGPWSTRGARRQKGDAAMENERAISVGRSDTGDGVARGKRGHRWRGRAGSMIQRGESAVYL